MGQGLTSVFVFQNQVFPYTNEIYPTTHRGMAVGSCSAASRVGGILTPTLSEMLANFHVVAPYGMFAGVAMLAGLTILSVPIETTGHDLPASKGTAVASLESERQPLIKKEGEGQLESMATIED